MPRTAELVQAFLWTCDECGLDNFERGVGVSPESIDLERLPVSSYEEAELIREFIEAGGEGGFVRAPSRVRCKHCHTNFDAVPA